MQVNDGLVDLGSLTEKVLVRGKPLDVYGISVDGLCYLIKNFPEFKLIMEQKASELTAEKLFDTGPKIAAAIISLGLTDASASTYDDLKSWEKHIVLQAKKVRALGILDQINLLGAILKLTLPDGVGPFVSSLNSLTSTISGTPTASDIKSQEVSAAQLQMVDPNLSSGSRRLNS